MNEAFDQYSKIIGFFFFILTGLIPDSDTRLFILRIDFKIKGYFSEICYLRYLEYFPPRGVIVGHPVY